MSSHYAKPENALRKAKDLIRVDRPAQALKTLHSILLSKRYRTWQQTHEKIMFVYIELAVNLRRNVKDALVQYRMICQQANAASLEKVLREYRRLSEEKTTEAQTKAAEAYTSTQETKDKTEDAATVVAHAVEIVEDLEEESPEAIMLAAMSGEGTRERMDRQILTPWVKYLWETYRTILDVLRNNSKLELLYHQTARQAFEFCQRFGRNMEFRRLCEILRQHLATIGRYQQQSNSVNLNNAETQALYLTTRFEQLRIASELELWQEAYRTIEDIHENMRLSHAEPKPELMKTYYEKLAAIFWASGNYLFHAYSLHKYFTLAADDNMSQEERTRLASAVVIASLVITGGGIDETHNIMLGIENEGNMKLAQLLGFKKETPNRARLLALINSTNVLQQASTTTIGIHDLLENQFGPLSLYKKLQPLLTSLEQDEQLSRYLKPLQHVTIIRVLQQLSTVFKSMKMDKFTQLIPQMTPFAVERIIMQAISADLLQLHIDHRNQLISFPEEDLESHRLRDQLSSLSRALSGIADKLAPPEPVIKKKEREQVFKLITSHVDREHDDVFVRQQEIEQRKQTLEKELLDKEKRESEQKAAAAAERKKEELKRLSEESARREAERLKKEQQDRELAAKQQLASEMKKKLEIIAPHAATKAEKKIQLLTADLENVEKSQLLKVQEEVMEQQRRENERRKRESARRIDFTVRAIRLEEHDALIQSQKKKAEEDREQFLEDFQKFLEQDKKNHEKALGEKERLYRMQGQKNLFAEKLLARRQELFEVESQRRAEKQAKKLEARRREEERRERERREQEERERIEREERERQEEEERIAREAEEARRREREELRRKEREEAERKAALQRQREEEAEQRERERRGLTGSARAPERDIRDRPERTERSERPERPAGGSAWRRGDDDRERERERDAPRRDEREPRNEWRRPGDEDREPRAERERPAGGAWRRDEPAAAPRRDEAPRRTGDSAWRRDETSDNKEETAASRWKRDDRADRADRGDRDAPRRDFGRRDDAPRRDDDRGDRRDFRRDDRERRDERPAAGGDRWRRGDEEKSAGGNAGGDRWRRGGDADRERGPIRRQEEETSAPAPAAAASEQTQEDDDGFTTVGGRAKKGGKH